MPLLSRTVPLVALVALMSACGGAPAAAPAQAPTPVTVAVRSIAFQPATVTVPAGTEVTWTSEDAGVAHTVTSGEVGEGAVPGVTDAKPSKPDGTFDGPLDDAGATYRFTFSKPGTYAYFCAVHPSMTGEVVVG